MRINDNTICSDIIYRWDKFYELWKVNAANIRYWFVVNPRILSINETDETS